MEPQNWFELKGDETLALDWPLDENSHVWEIGGFAGRWAFQMWEKFHCNIRIFEPQIWAVVIMLEKFKDIDKIIIRPYGLWTKDASLPLGGFETDGASILKGNQTQLCEFRDFRNEIVYSYDVDVCLMNIEGTEYILIPEFIQEDVMQHFNYFWCQFHPGLVEDGEKKSEAIFKALEKTHEMIWNCYPTAVAWRRK